MDAESANKKSMENEISIIDKKIDAKISKGKYMVSIESNNSKRLSDVYVSRNYRVFVNDNVLTITWYDPVKKIPKNIDECCEEYDGPFEKPVEKPAKVPEVKEIKEFKPVEKLGHILDVVLPAAGKCGGKVFGGFVRDILVPHYEMGVKLENCESFKDVDLWFTSSESYQKFRTLLGLETECNCGACACPSNERFGYTFNMHNVWLERNGIHISFMDCVIADTYPVNDFDVNFLTYQFTGSGEYTKKVEGNLFPFNSTYRYAYKVAHMRQEYLAKLDLSKYSRREISGEVYYRILRIHKRYLQRGWKVFLPNGEQIKLEDFTYVHHEHGDVFAIEDWKKIWDKYNCKDIVDNL
jgi:hypothetical protein